MQINPNKSKEIAWIYLDSFGRIGAFQWVTANPNKKIFLLPFQASRNVSIDHLTRPPPRRRNVAFQTGG
jgi:hypothetical protein